MRHLSLSPPMPLLLALAAALVVLLGWWLESVRHGRRLDAIALRVHVNGIRGKSTVTRIVAGLLRERGVPTVAKCTGTHAAVIHADGRESPILRRGAATILEQLDVIRRHVPRGTQALVVECMALLPRNQRVSERRIIRSHVGVLTNVREDHQDVMGETLPEIARSLLETCPDRGVLVTAETDPSLRELMREACDARGSKLLVADADEVTSADLAGFPYVAFRENVAIGLVIARLLGIPRDVAMRGMHAAPPDPGSLILRHVRLGESRVTWANLLAVNDRESTIASVQRLAPFRTTETVTVGLLNNRDDREHRALQFADIAARDLDLDRIALLGAYESVVARRLVERHGIREDRLLRLGAHRNPDLPTLLRHLVHDQRAPHVLLIGLVNIHTRAADLLRGYLEAPAGAES